ncbi:MAG TPA: YbaK/EbsC family protein [Micromonosporaceae bacterium]|jgi:Cys-tRNA(Pro) deacylase
MATPATDALDSAGVTYRLVHQHNVTSIEEAAAQSGVDVSDIIKTIVVRRADDDFVFVLVPGGRAISWPKLRAVLGVKRLSLPDAATAKDVTGYERGTITPFGSSQAWPVVADERIEGREIRLGAGAHDIAVVLSATDAVRALDASYADVTDRVPA